MVFIFGNLIIAFHIDLKSFNLLVVLMFRIQSFISDFKIPSEVIEKSLISYSSFIFIIIIIIMVLLIWHFDNNKFLYKFVPPYQKSGSAPAYNTF
jgi:hypothetical protein